jgi:hypothetical protein
MAPTCHANTIAQFNNLDNAFFGAVALDGANSLALLISTKAAAALSSNPPSLAIAPNSVFVFNIFFGAAGATRLSRPRVQVASKIAAIGSCELGSASEEVECDDCGSRNFGLRWFVGF